MAEMIEFVPADGDYAQPAEPGWRGTDWSTYERDAVVAGRRLRYLDVDGGGDEGSGSVGDGGGRQCFVLVHGMGGRWQHWLETIPTLATHGRVIAVDLPGFGCSEQPVGKPSLDGFADAVADLVRQLGVERVVLAGHSMGGLIAIRFAARHPELAEAIVPVAGAVFQFSGALAGRNLLRSAVQQPEETAAIAMEVATAGLPSPAPVRRLVVRSPQMRRLLLWPYAVDPLALPADVAQILIDGSGAPGVFPTSRAISNSDPYEGIGSVVCPVLSIAADADRIVPMSDTEALQRDLADARTVVLEGCGHLPMLERPQAMNRALLDFVEELS